MLGLRLLAPTTSIVASTEAGGATVVTSADISVKEEKIGSHFFVVSHS